MRHSSADRSGGVGKDCAAQWTAITPPTEPASIHHSAFTQCVGQPKLMAHLHWKHDTTTSYKTRAILMKFGT